MSTKLKLTLEQENKIMGTFYLHSIQYYQHLKVMQLRTQALEQEKEWVRTFDLHSKQYYQHLKVMQLRTVPTNKDMFLIAGGLLVCLPRDKAQSYCDELQVLDGHPAWIVGEVVYGKREARIDKDPKIIEV